MDDEIHAVPHLAQCGKGGIDGGGIADIAIDHRRRLQRFDQWHHPLAEQVALVGKGQFGARIVQGLGDAPGDGVLVGHAHDQAAFALHEAWKCHAGVPVILGVKPSHLP